MKKTLTLALALILVLAMALPVFAADAGTVEASKYVGSIDIENAYYDMYSEMIDNGETQFDVYTADGLTVLTSLINGSSDGFSGKTVSLKNDLIFNEGNAEDWESEAPDFTWTPIANFRGTFDGEGHTVSGIYLKVNKDHLGFFSVLKEGATVKNLGLINSYFEQSVEKHESTGNSSYSPSFIGRINAQNVTVDGLYSEAIIKANGLTAGGIVTLVSNTDTQVSNDAAYTADDETAYATIKNCVFNGKIEAVNGRCAVGGIVGYGAQYQHCKLVVSDCVHLGTVSVEDATTTSNAAKAGAIVGQGSYVVLERCLNFGKVIPQDCTGLVKDDAPYDNHYKLNGMVGLLTTSNKTDTASNQKATVKISLTDVYLFTDLANTVFSSDTVRDQHQTCCLDVTPAIVIADSNTIKGEGAKTVLTALKFEGEGANWSTREGDYPLPTAVVNILADTATNEADPDIDIDAIIAAGNSNGNGSNSSIGGGTTNNNNNNTNNNTDTTAAPETTPAPADTTAEEEGGCGSTVGLASVAVLAVTGVAGIAVFRKKED